MGRRDRFRVWRRRRPLVGGVLIAAGGVEEFFSGQLDIGRLHVQLGIEGLQATIIPALLLLLGILVIAMPAHRLFYGVIALVLGVYSLIGVNLGGFVVGMLLVAVGGVLAVSWAPRTADPGDDDSPSGTTEDAEGSAVPEGARAS